MVFLNRWKQPPSRIVHLPQRDSHTIPFFEYQQYNLGHSYKIRTL